MEEVFQLRHDAFLCDQNNEILLFLFLFPRVILFDVQAGMVVCVDLVGHIEDLSFQDCFVLHVDKSATAMFV